MRLRFTRPNLSVYLTGVLFVCALMAGAGYWGGEMFLHAGPTLTAGTSNTTESAATVVNRGRTLFQTNCAHCHGDDARGTDEAPDLTQLHKSDARIASVVKNGIKGEMPRFDQKLRDQDVNQLIRYIRSLNVR